MHENSKTKKLRYLYVIEVDNRGEKSKFYGQTKIYYVGTTDDLGKRIFQHLNGINSKFLSQNFKHARKKLVFVSYIYGDEYDAIEQETRLKNKSKPQKKKIISADLNKLVKYVPLKAIILKKYRNEEEQIALKI